MRLLRRYTPRNDKLMEKSYIEPLTKAGLSYSQSEVYEILLKNGPLKAGKIYQKSDLKRSLVYKELDDLLKLGLIEKLEDKGKVAVFAPLHPSKLHSLVEQQQHKLKTAELLLDGVLGQMASDFNLVSGMPGVLFFEGVEGAIKVLNDSLTSTTEILSYIDNEAVSKYGADINKAYVAKRHKSKIRKKMKMMNLLNKNILINFFALTSGNAGTVTADLLD